MADGAIDEAAAAPESGKEFKLPDGVTSGGCITGDCQWEPEGL